MRTIILTSTTFTGGVIFKFHDSGRLASFDTSEAELSDQQAEWLVRKCPAHLNKIQEILGNSVTAKLTEIKDNETDVVTFDMFWDKYNSKTRSNKIASRRKWERMPKGERLKAFKFINKYDSSLPPGIGRKLAETYLNVELWNN